ncbi:MAG: rod shape-determining protein MreC [Eubacteriaceae bacterium]
MKYFFQKKFIYIILLVGIIMGIFVFFLTTKRTESSSVESAILSTASPIEKLFYRASLNTNEFLEDIKNFRGLKDTKIENEKRIETLEKQLVDYQLVLNQNKDLSELLNFTRENKQFDLLLSEVIAIEPMNGVSQLIIDKGTKDGLAIEMPVVSGNGLVGTLTEISDHTGVVKTINDPTSGLNGKSSRSGSYVRIQGDLERGLIGLIEPGTDLIPGDYLVTTGLYSKMPSNLMIGTVEKIQEKEGSLELEVFIKPVVDFRTLGVIGVVKQVKE